jgi:3',5'-cyclic AMP phosphodiesterase CpdA
MIVCTLPRLKSKIELVGKICCGLVVIGMAFVSTVVSTASARQVVSPSTPAAKVPTQQAEPVKPTEVARGRVFIDTNNDGLFGEGERPLEGVRVSNGLEIVTTDESGGYSISITDDGVVFVIKPAGYRTRLNEDNLPRFYYLHKPNGSPQLQFPGVAPTGPMPKAIDFPLYPQEGPSQFRMVLFGDTQPRDLAEVDFIAHDVVNDMIGVDAAFGVTLGDIVFDDLNMFEPLNQTIGLIGIPWYNVIGNHDVNYDAKSRLHVNETYERFYGPSYYSFDYGPAHFVVMDNIDWVMPTDPAGKGEYQGGFGKRQLEFLKNDLEQIPKDQMVVLMMHIPLPSTTDHQDLFRLIEQRPFCISIAAHQHYHQHLFFDEAAGWKGTKPHHHLINVTVCGSWWSGKKDERGIPHAIMSDGAPNGYSIMTFNGSEYRLEYVGAGNDRGRQMRIEMPNEVQSEKGAKFTVNVFDGSVKSRVWFTIDASDDWQECQKINEVDPLYLSLYEEDQAMQPPPPRALGKPSISSHLWTGELPSGLSAGVHLLRVKTRDMSDTEHLSGFSFRVVPAAPPPPATTNPNSNGS